MKSLLNLLFIFSVLLFTSCRIKKEVSVKPPVDLPAAYNDGVDTSAQATLSPSEIFADSSLYHLVDLAVNNNPDIIMAFERLKIAGAGLTETRGALFPTLGANATYAKRKYGLYTMDGAGNISTYIRDKEIVPVHLDDYFVALQSNWEIDVWGKLRNRKRAAQKRFLAEAEGRNFVVTMMVAEVAQLYYTLKALDEKLLIVDSMIALQTKGVELARFQKQAGIGTELGVKQLESQLLNTRSLRVSILQQINETGNQINLLTGVFPGGIKRSSESILNIEPVKIAVGKPSALLANRPDVRRAELELLASGADVRAAKAAFYPSLSLTGHVGWQAYRPELLFLSPQSVAYSVLGGLVAPLINRYALKAALEYAQGSQNVASQVYRKSVLNAYYEVYGQLQQISNLDEIVKLKEEESEAVGSASVAADELFRMGRATYLEVLTTQRNLLETRLSLVEARLGRVIASVKLYRALGGGWR